MKIKTILFCIIIILSFSCKKSDNEYPSKNQEEYLVDKIYNYNDDLVAEYFYDNNNKLVKKFVTEHLGSNYEFEWASYSDELEYQNGRVSKITRKDITYNNFNYQTYISYDTLKRINKIETYRNNQLIEMSDAYSYKNNILTNSVFYQYDSIFYNDTIIYDNYKNVIKYIYERPEIDDSGEYISGTKTYYIQNFSYDNQTRPNFGLDNLFIFQPLPFYNQGDLQRQLSVNNLTEVDGQINTYWIYTYNENGLPTTMEKVDQGIETSVPNVLKFTYKKIN